jgi:hypothetical protein
MAPRKHIQDTVQDGKAMRWCKECAKFMGTEFFHTRKSGYRELLCREHVAARQRGVYKVRADVAAFCRRTGIELLLTLEDLRVMGMGHDLDVLRPVPIDPTQPLTLENSHLISFTVRRTLESLLQRQKDPKYYQKVLTGALWTCAGEKPVSVENIGAVD